jgi:hypothetical protein
MSVETFEPKLRSDPNAHSHPRTRGRPFTKGNDGVKRHPELTLWRHEELTQGTAATLTMAPA